MSIFIYHPQVEKYVRSLIAEALVEEEKKVLNLTLTKEKLLEKMIEI